MFTLNASTTVDDVIEHLINRLNTDFLGGAIEINHFCHWDEKQDDHEYDRQMTMLVKSKMLKYDLVNNPNHTENKVILKTNGVIAYKEGGWKKYLIRIENEKNEKIKLLNTPSIKVAGNAIIGDNNVNNHLGLVNLESSHSLTNLEPTINAPQPKKDDQKTHKSNIFNKIYKWTDHKLISGIILLILGFFLSRILSHFNIF